VEVTVKTESEARSVARSLYGEYRVPELVGVNADVEFIGPLAGVHMRIDDGRATVSAPTGQADLVIRSDIEDELLRLVRGETNVIVAALQDRASATGDLLLAFKVAGSMPHIGKQLGSAPGAQGGA